MDPNSKLYIPTKRLHRMKNILVQVIIYTYVATTYKWANYHKMLRRYHKKYMPGVQMDPRCPDKGEIIP